MSQEEKNANIRDIIREKLEKESRKILNEGGKITPYHIMEGLKDNAGGRDDLTFVGRLIRDVLAERAMIENISWIAFYFDFPGREFSYSEKDMRNWLAVHNNSQGLLEKMHKVVREKFHQIKDYYAPSILFQQISSSRPENPELIKKFRERWWLYKLNDNVDEFCPCLNKYACRPAEVQDVEIISFEESETSDGKAVRIAFCPPVSDDQTNITLGSLLNETEEESLKKFRNFKKIVHQISDDKAELSCDFYARVPLFFCGTEQEYVTDIFVALSHGREKGEITRVLQVAEIVKIISDMLPPLKTCVSLINSQVAYSLGEVTRRDKMSALLSAVIRHDINNFAGAVDGSVSQLLEYWEIMEREEIYTILREVRANITLYTMSIDLDFLWGVNKENLPDSLTPLSQIREELDKSWRFSTITDCEFNGDWRKKYLVPKVCRIVLSNLLRNAVNNNDDSIIIMDCDAKRDKISFGCLSENPISDFWKHRAFDAPLSPINTSHNRGFWICRYIIKFLKGKFYLAPPQGSYKTHIRFDIPKF